MSAMETVDEYLERIIYGKGSDYDDGYEPLFNPDDVQNSVPRKERMISQKTDNK